MKKLSDMVRIDIQAKKAQRDFKRRLAIVEIIAEQNNCTMIEACNILEERNRKTFGMVSDDVLADLNAIREEYVEDASA